MKIAILGAGAVGTNLARALASRGHAPRIGVRDPAKIAALIDEIRAGEGSALATTPREAVAGASMAFLAVPFSAVPATLAAAGDLEGVILVDCTNPLVWNDGAPGLAPGLAPSGAAEVARLAPGARVVKALNTHGAELSVTPEIAGRSVTVMVATDDAEAGAKVRQVLREIGFDPVDAGPLRHAEHLEHLAVLWIHLALRGGLGRRIGFSLLR